MGEFDRALVCLGGHVVNSRSLSFPQGNAAFCSQCGERTISACESCRAPIRGKYVQPRTVDRRAFTPPLHCQGCGAPYPWKETKLKAAKEVTAGLGLEEEERALLERHRASDS